MALQGFDEAYYLSAKLAALQAANPTDWGSKDTAFLTTVLTNAGLTAESHYEQYGWSEGLAPNAYFNATEYKLAKAQAMFDAGGYISVAAAQAAFDAAWTSDPYQHYLQYGSAEGVNPSNAFDESSYLDAKLAALQADTATATEWAGKTAADVLAAFTAAGLSVLGHYVAYGATEGLTVTVVPTAEQVVTGSATGSVGEVLTLTTGMDTITGTANNDIYYGVIDTTTPASNTFSSFDSINAGLGTDTFSLSMNDNYDATSSLSSIELFELKATAIATFNASGLTGITSISDNRSTNALTVSNIGSTDTKLIMNNLSNAAADLTATFANTAVAGTSDTVVIDIIGGTGGTAVGDNQVLITSASAANGAENLTVNVSGGAAYLGTLESEENATDSQVLEKLTVNASSDFTVGTALDFSGTGGTVDASTSTGKINLTFGAEANTVTGGSGNDTFVFGANLDNNDTIDGGAGTDTVSVLEANMDAYTSLSFIKNSVATVTNVEAVTISDAVITGATYSATDIASSVNTVTYALGGADSTLTFGSGANTLNLKGVFTAGHTIVTSGVATNDTLTISLANTTADVASQNYVTTGIEELTISNSLTAATTYDFGNITMTASSGGTTAIKFVGSKNANADAITAATIDASGLTGTGALTMDAAAVSVTTITGSANADTLLGDDASTINGGGGNDTITGGTGNDTLNGGDGNDTITMNTGKDTVAGGAGDDTVVAAGNLTYEDVSVDGGEGTDILSITDAQAAAISAYSTANKATFDAAVVNFETLLLSTDLDTGFAANDLLNMSTIVLDGTNSVGSDTTITKIVDASVLVYNQQASAADDTLTVTMASATGSADSLTVKLTDDATGATATVENGEIAAAGVETININSTRDSDNTTTTRNNLDLTDAAAAGLTTLNITGNVALTSIVSSTTLTSIDASTSTISGTNGMIITATGTTAATTVTGSNANDTFSMGSGIDTVNGGIGDDTIYGYSGADVLSGGVGNDTLDGGSGNDTIDGGEGADTINTSGGTDTIDGGAGTDILSISSSAYSNISGATITNVETLDMNSNAVTMTSAQYGMFTTVTDAAAATLTDAATITLGTSIVSVTFANATNAVTASTTAANYTLTGGTGSDTFNFGSDTISNADTINGTSGSDTLNITGNTIVGATALNGISNIDTVNFSNTSSAVSWTSQDNDATAAMTVDASSLTTGVATLNFALEADASMTLIGGNAGDTITGGDLADVILGNAGDDTITGGAGADTITTGLGADSVILTSEATFDTISDFTAAAGGDQIDIDVSAINGGAIVDSTGTAVDNTTTEGFISYTVGATSAANAVTSNIIFITNTTGIDSTADVDTALAANNITLDGGGTDVANTEGVALVFYDADGGFAWVGYVEDSAAATAGVFDGTGSTYVQLAGLTMSTADYATLVATNFDFI